MKKRKWLSLLLAVMMLVSAVPFFPVTADAADGTVEVSTWAELKKALEYTTNCSVVKVVKDIETKSLNGHTGLHQDNIIFMSMAMDKVLDLNGHTVNAYGGKARYALYPVWLLNTTWNGNQYVFAMNGQTGKFVGDLPVDKAAAKRWTFLLAAIFSVASYGVAWGLHLIGLI